MPNPEKIKCQLEETFSKALKCFSSTGELTGRFQFHIYKTIILDCLEKLPSFRPLSKQMRSLRLSFQEFNLENLVKDFKLTLSTPPTFTEIVEAIKNTKEGLKKKFPMKELTILFPINVNLDQGEDSNEINLDYCTNQASFILEKNSSVRVKYFEKPPPDGVFLYPLIHFKRGNFSIETVERENYFEEFFKEHPCFFECQYRARDYEFAIEYMQEQLFTILGFLAKYEFPGLSIARFHPSGMQDIAYLYPKGHLIFENGELTEYRPYFQLSNVHLEGNYELFREASSRMKQIGEFPRKMQERYLEAMRVYYQAMTEPYLAPSFLKFYNVIESLLSTEHNNDLEMIRDLIRLLDFPSEWKVRDLFPILYKKRNLFVHDSQDVILYPDREILKDIVEELLKVIYNLMYNCYQEGFSFSEYLKVIEFCHLKDFGRIKKVVEKLPKIEKSLN